MEHLIRIVRNELDHLTRKLKTEAAQDIAAISSKEAALHSIYIAEIQIAHGLDNQRYRAQILWEGAHSKALAFGATEQEINETVLRAATDGVLLTNWNIFLNDIP